MDTLLPSQPQSYRQLIKSSFKLYRACFKRVIFIAFLLSITAFVPRLISDIIGQDLFANLPPLSPHRLWIMLIEIGGLVFFISLLWRIHCVIHAMHESLADDFKIGIKKVFFVIIASFIQSVLVFAVTVLIYGFMVLLHEYRDWFRASDYGLFIFYIFCVSSSLLIMYMATLFAFFIPLIAIEDKGIFSSLRTSIQLGWNHSWRIFSTQVTPWILYIFLLFIVKFVFGVDIHIYLVEHGVHTVASTLLHIVIFAIYIPWVAALLLTQLKDLELRKHIDSKL